MTAPCAFVNAPAACIIGVIAGGLVIEGSFFVERVLKVDDPVGAVAVHGINGAFGCLALGLFADGTYGDGWNGVAGPVRGLLYGDASQFLAQCVGVGTNIVVIGVLGYVTFKINYLVFGLRVSPEVESLGLDLPEMGVPGYVGVSDGLALPELTHNNELAARVLPAEGR